ncbi:PstS family phosphate ABC transporter substrate-binding protein [Chlorobium sp. BLA1]|uniref:PstS family phosphate ABC transporter substrate-binding protein n=1 Tax=Candidatus Chlorobium masyuteum TaxID=2716876 RepID=UPI00142241FE|nr:PstS family phosphate ABC transporter substrate-binding protein [Candidatus Chlorobium masyuteum]NHQ60231.1 PstS family phosphate ABC transporter substrate-binding protein [Candidatus Chlorobium masyuteum]NTU44509.1 PstS family phosphate ABC transporter substrate-binding protein [Chlorobiaceae bacterium]
MKRTISIVKKIFKSAAFFSLFSSGTMVAYGADSVVTARIQPTGLVADNKIIIDGSPSAGLVANVFAMDFLKTEGIVVKVNESDSERGIYSLIYKNCDIATTARPMRPQELAEAKREGVKPVQNVLAHDAIVMVVHPANTLSGLTIDQIRKIYTGTYTNWSQLGGPNRPIVLLQRENKSGTQETFTDVVMGKTPISMRAVTLFNNREIIGRIASTPNAIGMIGRGWIDNSVKTLLVNGVDHSPTTIKDKSYPLHRLLYMYTNGQPTGVLKRFVEYSTTPDGQRALSENGFIAENR